MKTIYIFFFAAFLFFPLISKSQVKTGSVTVGTGSNIITMNVIINSSTNLVSFSITGPSSKYFGFGFNTTSMTSGSYTLLANVGGSNVSEYSMAFHSAPVLQATQNLSAVNSSTSGTTKTVTFQRPLNTGDANDYIFSTSLTTINIIWAYGSTTTLNGHAGKGVSSITFTDPCNIPVTNLGQSTICLGDSVDVFGSFVFSAGDYFDTLTSVFGCDSILKRTVAVTEIDTAVATMGNVLTAVSGADSYQWYNCVNSQPIANATSPSFTATTSGTYYVQITKQSCTEISGCHLVLIDGLNQFEDKMISFYPNPVSNFLHFDGLSSQSIDFLDISGKKVLEGNLINGKIDLSTLSPGFYIFEVKDADKLLLSSKIIKN